MEWLSIARNKINPTALWNNELKTSLSHNWLSLEYTLVTLFLHNYSSLQAYQNVVIGVLGVKHIHIFLSEAYIFRIERSL